MKPNPIFLVPVLLLCSLFSIAQEDARYRITLKSGSFIPSKNIEQLKIDEVNQRAAKTDGKSFVLLQFENIPTLSERTELKLAGIELLDYIAGNAYTATISGAMNTGVLLRTKARAVVELSAQQKMEPALAAGIFPAWAVKTPGTVDVWVSFPKSFSYTQVVTELAKKNIDIQESIYQQYRIISLRIAANRLAELAVMPCIEYVQAAPKEDEPVNHKSTVNTKANVLQSSLPGGRNLKGSGVVVGVGDNADPLAHVDFLSRLINRSAAVGGSHGVHVTGIVGGAGIVNERYTGFAPKATIVAQQFSNILAYASLYAQDHGMVITNNSYGNVVNDCNSFGVYTLYSRILDQQAFQLPNLQHVFSAGNSGSFNCAPYLNGYSNVLGDYQTAKNVITVGNVTELGALSASSSEGPVRDGRIKPEIVAQGTSVISTFPPNTYLAISGTSMSAPAISGGLALLYERYKQLHSGVNPKNGLMKALLVNGATDIGNPGPDFSYGFGWMNLVRSVKMLEQNNFFNTSVNAAAQNTHSITVPAGSNLAQLKVMLYWNDSAANILANPALINDLDLEVTDPSAALNLPQLLDHTPTNVNAVATTGADHLNNIEQVIINTPVPGTYTFTVKGTTIPSATNHEYFLVFDTIAVSAALTYPIGGERLQSTDAIYISWDAYGNSANDFTLQYSTDNGATWNTISATVGAALRQYAWTIPSVTTNQAKIKLIHNGTGIESISEPFTIVGVPAVTLSAVQCEGYIALDWGAITGATDYEVMILQGGEMIPVATTAATTYTIKGLNKDSVYWVAVRARVSGDAGRRSIAISRQPNTGTCAGAVSDNDVKLDAILSPAKSGRVLTSTALSATQAITIRIKNLDDAVTTGNIPVRYTIGANPSVNETIVAPNIAAGATYDYTFTATADLSAVGSTDILVQVLYAVDPVLENDTLRKTFKQLDNAFIDLTTDFLDNIESASIQSHVTNQIGLNGLDRYDFVTSTIYGRIRSFINSGIAFSGSKALTLDADRYNGGGTTDSLTGTFNLTGYNPATRDIRLDFMYKQHGQVPNAANNVWIRGDDTQPWIQVYDLYANQADPGIYKRSTSIELSDILANAVPAQTFGSSFQVKWGQWGQISTSDNETAAGYSFDDIRLYEVTDDIQLISIDTPVVASCGLSNTVPVRITIRNSANSTVSSIPVKFSIDNGAIITETIPSIAGNTSIQYTFTATADLSALGIHTVKVWADLATDNYADNDTALTTLYNSPVVSSFPYLQNFEGGEGSWHSAGKNNSWAYGTPAATRINRAASGSKAWKTNLTGNYNDGEKSYLYSPCFDITGMTVPTLSLSIALDLEDCGVSLCDAAYVEYSADGNTWTKLGTNASGTNWYNKNYAGNYVWSVQNYTRWHVATVPLPTGLSRLRLRFVIESDPYVSREGIAIDDIHVYDNVKGIYEGPPYTSVVTNQPAVNGMGWFDFEAAGKLVASVNPNGQNMGSTDAQTYIHTGAVRTNAGQYYHNRNITIKPTTVNLADSATVRFYFLDSETEALINATGCGLCSKPASAYELGVSKYSGADAVENGDILDNSGAGSWLFITAVNAVKVPFDKGYYAEFKVKDFSEFWLNNGGPNNNQTLPVELISFTAKKNANQSDVIVQWVTASETNTARYEIELAKGNEEYRQSNFVKIGEVLSNGNSNTQQQFAFTDAENYKSGVRYYRLKIVDKDGRFSYSTVRSVVFNNEIKWQVYPNPSIGKFNLVYQAGEGETITVQVHDVNGKSVQQVNTVATGFVQKIELDMSGSQFAKGLYLLEMHAGDTKQVFRLIKQ
jgi:hypothetical protein